MLWVVSPPLAFDALDGAGGKPRGNETSSSVDTETGGKHENLPAVHSRRPESLYRHRLRAPHLGDQESGWVDGLPPGGHRRARGLVVGSQRYLGPEILQEVRRPATRRRWKAASGQGRASG